MKKALMIWLGIIIQKIKHEETELLCKTKRLLKKVAFFAYKQGFYPTNWRGEQSKGVAALSSATPFSHAMSDVIWLNIFFDLLAY